MSFLSKLGLGFVALVFSLLASATVHAKVSIDEPWVRATVAQQQATGAFMKIVSTTEKKLVSADSSVAEHVEVHEMALIDDVMKMREIPFLDIPAGQVVELKPGGYHIMLINLKEQMQEGMVIPLSLVFETSAGEQETIEIEAPVLPITTGKVD